MSHCACEALQNGHDVVALVRDQKRATRILPPETTLVRADVTTSAGLHEAVDRVDAIIATLNGDAERVDFEGMLNVLRGPHTTQNNRYRRTK